MRKNNRDPKTGLIVKKVPFKFVTFCCLFGVLALCAGRALADCISGWEHDAWIEGTVTWALDGNGDPYATISDAQERCEWVDTCEGTTEPAETHPVGYTPGTVTTNGSGMTYRVYYTWTAYSTCPIHPTPIITSSSFPLPVHWSTDTGISGGALVGSATRTAVAGDNVSVAVETASDNDKWSIKGGPQNVNAADGIRYKWTATGGTFANDSAASTSWTPTGGGTFTLTCKIDDPWDDGQTPPVTGVSPPNLGNRNDAAITRTITVTVAGTLTTSLEVRHKTADATSTTAEESSVVTTTGGTAYAILNLNFGQGAHIASTSATMRITENPDTTNGVTHPFEQNHVDVPISFTNAAGWERYYDPDDAGPKAEGWWPAPEAPTAAATSTSAMQYRYKYSWDTTTSSTGTSPNPAGGTPPTVSTALLGHNGAHTISLIAVDGVSIVGDADGGIAYGAPTKSKPSDTDTTIGNIVVADATASSGDSNYLRFDPSNVSSTLNSPIMSFTIKDNGRGLSDTYRYVWKVFIRATNEEDWDVVDEYTSISGTRSTPGVVSFTLNDEALLSAFPSSSPMADPTAPDVQRAALTEPGTYAFDIQVDKVEASSSVEWLPTIRSSHLHIPKWMPSPIVDEDENQRPGHSVEGWSTGNDDAFKYYASYYLDSDRNASNMTIDFVGGPDLDVLSETEGNKVKSVPHLDTLIYEPTESDGDGTYRGIFNAEDAHKDSYRDHFNRSILAINRKLYAPAAKNFMAEFLNNADVNYPPTLYQGRVGYSSKKITATYDYHDFFNAMMSSWIVTSFGHGFQAGIMQMGEAPHVIGSRPAGSTGGIALTDLPANSASNLRLLILLHCGSGVTSEGPDSPNWGNLIDSASLRGTRASVGFSQLIPYNYSPEFNNSLWRYLTGAGGLTPKTISNAVQTVSDEFDELYPNSADQNGVPTNYHSYILPSGSTLKVTKMISGPSGPKYRPQN